MDADNQDTPKGRLAIFRATTGALILTSICVGMSCIGSTAFAAQFGAVSGTLTWQFNDVIGTKGDVGATAILLPEKPKCKISSDIYFTEAVYAGTDDGNNLKRCGLFVTKADGFGHYHFQHIPPGKYFMLVSSQAAHRDPDVPIDQDTQDTLGKYMSNASVKAAISNMFRFRKHSLDDVEIDSGETTEYSHDFGNTGGV